MRAIIPAKASSTRIRDKNWRDFHQGRCLVDLNIEALLGCGFHPEQIHVSCEDAGRLEGVTGRYGVTPLPRHAELCGNDVPLTEWIRGICAQLPGDDDIAWSQVCDPLFMEHGKVLAKWPEAKESGCDSICVVHPLRAFLLDARFRPVGWQFGEWHTPSQRLPQLYTFPFTLSVLTRDAIHRTGYHVGAHPHWYVSCGASIDIDTMADFRLAQHEYDSRNA